LSVTDGLTSNLLVQAYARGLFPMAESRSSKEIYWVDPEQRGVIPLDGFHVSRRLKRFVRGDPFQITVDAAFEQVIEACGSVDYARGRFDSWINPEIVRAYVELHRLGLAHSVECWAEDRLAGGVYGVSLKGAFFGESMFSRETGGSKTALVHLVAMLKAADYSLFDSQFVNDHLKQFGVLAVPKHEFQVMLADALSQDCQFPGPRSLMTGEDAIRQITGIETAG
jgi:leucyl/phenylalanyl-tRNA--protein transferase